MVSLIINSIKGILGLGLLLLCCWSCEKSIDYQLQNQSSEVVMYAFPMPDSILKIHGSKTTNILSLSDFEGVKDLRVSLLVDDSEIIDTDYPFGSQSLNIDQFKCEENMNVKIIFEVADGSVIIGNTVIPKAVQIVSVDTSRVMIMNDDNKKENMLRCFVEINDPANNVNYYQIRVDSKKTLIGEGNDTIQKTESITYIKEDKVFSIRDDESVLLAEVDFQGTFNDFLFDGSNYKVKLLIPEVWLAQSNGEIKNELSIYLYTLTADYYEFIRSSVAEEAYREYPFSEQGNVYSNVDNGLGVVAGLSVDKDSVSIFDTNIELF